MKIDNVPSTLHELLLQIVDNFGEEILTDSRLCGILNDLALDDTAKYYSVVVCAINDHIGQKLLALRELDDVDFSLKLNMLKQSFQEDNFLQHGIADYIIDCYIFALGWLDTVESVSFEELNAAESKAGELSFLKQEDGDYCGNFGKDKQRSGFGILRKEDGSYYAGNWKLNTRSGIGFTVDVERNKYAGEWRLNRRSGIGIEILAEGMRYAGEWKNGKMHGPGILFFPNGERLAVRFINGHLSGEAGVFYLRDGTYVVGTMTMKGPNGCCLHYYHDGTYETENWINGQIKR